jgi:hypothetical protein
MSPPRKLRDVTLRGAARSKGSQYKLKKNYMRIVKDDTIK